LIFDRSTAGIAAALSEMEDKSMCSVEYTTEGVGPFRPVVYALGVRFPLKETFKTEEEAADKAKLTAYSLNETLMRTIQKYFFGPFAL
jgi:hypothetical protein